MTVSVQKELAKAIRKLSKFKSMAGVTSATIKEKMIFKKGTTIRRLKLLSKYAVIRAFKQTQKRMANT